MIELIAPVRDRTSFAAALKAGADSVYFGLGKLNMRASSKGIEPKDLKDIVKIAHDANVKVYITLNVIIYENEFKILDRLLHDCKKANADAVICWDLAVIQKCKEYEIPFHISTQANISNSIAARFYEAIGAKYVVLARECTLEQIKEIKRKTKMKIEVFAHGAMCVSISGRCFMSHFLYGKSANCGECLQPCRREYTVIEKETGYELKIGNNFILSPKDLCTLDILNQLLSANIDALKIEGRSRSPEYVFTVTKAYRTAIDAYYKNKYSPDLANELIEQVSKVYNRGFSHGFLYGQPGVGDWAASANNLAKSKKEYLGKVVNYYNKNKVAHIEIESSSLSIGDKIQIQGSGTGVKEVKIEELRVQDKPVDLARKGEATFPVDEKVRPNDLVYKIISAQ